MVTIVDVDGDTTWVKFTSLLAFFQRVGPVASAAVCSLIVIPLSNPFGCTVGFRLRYCCNRNNIVLKHAHCKVSQ